MSTPVTEAIHAPQRCRGPRCRAWIVMCHTDSGARQPINPEPDTLGNLVVDRLDGGRYVARYPSLLDPPDRVRFMPHHATCPDRDLFTRRRR